MKVIFLYCTIFMLFQACYAQAPAACDSTGIISCWRPIDAFFQAIGGTTSKDKVATANLTDSQLDSFCMSWNQSTSGCLASLRPQCTEKRKQQFIGEEDSLDFVCTTLPRFKLFKECLSNSTVVNGLKQCDLQFSNDLSQANSITTGTDAKNRAICNAAHTKILCKRDKVKMTCGTDASSWYEVFEEKKASPYLDQSHDCSDKGFCSSQNIDTCWYPVNAFLKFINKGDVKSLDFMFHTLEKAQIAQLCAVYDVSVSGCLSSLNKTCSLHTRMLFEGQEYMLDFLCNEGLEEFILHKDCYTNPSITSGMNECTRTLDRDLRIANRQPSPSRVDQGYCSAIKTAMECDQKIVSTNCNKNAGEWIKEYKLREYEPLLEQLKCEELSLHCTQKNVDACWLPTETYKKSIGFTDASQGFALFHLSDVQLRQFCQIYVSKVSDCLAKIRPFCNQITRKRFEGLEDSWDYLCKDTLDEYIKHKSCIATPKVQRELANCNKDFVLAVNDIVKPGSTMKKSEIDQKYCDAVQDDLDCDKKAVGNQCGKDAGKWTYEYQRRYLEPYLDHIACNFGGLSSGIKVLIALLILGSMALAAGLAIFAWHYYTKRKCEKSQTEHVRFDNPLSTADIPPNNMINHNQSPATTTTDNGYGNDSNVKVEKIDPTQYENQYSSNQSVNPAGNDAELASGDLSAGNPIYQYINTDEVKPELEV